MPSDRSARISDHFLRLTDPRRGKVTHLLINLVTIALCGTIAGTDDFVTMVAWAHQHQQWLAQFLNLTNGIPSHDCLNMLFRRLKPDEFERCLLSWLAALHDTSGGTLVAIDGKTLRRSFDVIVHGTSSAHDADRPAQGWRSKGIGCDRTLASKHEIR